ncbi:MAG: Eco57I restriction-modification methylase domain-containing protein, partial [Pirellulales bacterium]
MYVAFLEKGLSSLAREGLLGFIVPNKFMQADYGQNLRDLLTSKKAISSIVDFGSAQVFRGATTYTCLLFLCGRPCESFSLRANARNREPRDFLAASVEEKRRVDSLRAKAWTLTYSAEEHLLEKIE